MSRRSLLLFFITAMAVLSLCVVAPSMAFPRPGHYVYGRVYMHGELAPAGQTVTAMVAGIPFTTQTDAQGRFGYAPNYSLPADDLETVVVEGGSDGDPVYFSVNGQNARVHILQAERWAWSMPFEVGGLTQVDLHIVEDVHVYIPWVTK